MPTSTPTCQTADASPCRLLCDRNEKRRGYSPPTAFFSCSVRCPHPTAVVSGRRILNTPKMRRVQYLLADTFIGTHPCSRCACQCWAHPDGSVSEHPSSLFSPLLLFWYSLGLTCHCISHKWVVVVAVLVPADCVVTSEKEYRFCYDLYTDHTQGRSMARGRKTSLIIHLTPAERRTLRAWQRATSIPAGLARRGRILILLADGMTITDIATTVGISRRFVYKWVQRFLEQGLAGLADQPGRGHRRGQ